MSGISGFRVAWLLARIVALPLVGVAGLGTLGAYANVGVGSWRVTGSPAGGHEGGQVVTLAGGRVLVVYTEVEEVTPTHPTYTEHLAAALYEPRSGTWMPGPEPPGQKATTLLPLPDGGALLLGEAACGQAQFRCLPTAATYRLNAGDTEWTAAAPMHEPRADPTVVPLADGRVLVAGGFGDSCTPRVAFGYSCAPLASAEIFDPATGAWSPTAPMPEPRGGASAARLSDGSVLLVGGGSAALRYDPVFARWRTLGPAPGLTGTTLLALPGDRAIAIGSYPRADFYGSYGGAGKLGRLICESIAAEIYTAARDTWSAAPPLLSDPIACSS